MKVNVQSPAAKIERTSTAKSSSSSSGSAERSGEAARVEMSESAKAMQDLYAPERVDMERVERLREAVKNGEFRVDAETIAERMLDQES